MTGQLRAAAVLAAVLACSPCAADEAARGADRKLDRKEVFDPARVWKVHLTLPAKEFEAIQPKQSRGFPGFGPAKPQPRPKPGEPVREVHRNTFGMDLAWAVGTLEIGGHTFKDVAVRHKGNGTIADAAASVKKSLKIDLDRKGGTKTFHGVKTINLHCGAADPSKVRETLGYALYRAAGVPAPRTALAEVWLTVPGKHDRQLLGVYTLVEQVDKQFLREFLGNGTGLLMKPEGLREFADLGDDWKRYAKQYAARAEPTREQAARTIAFARLVAKGSDEQFRKEIDSFLDVDGYLRYLAATSFVSNSDSFFGLGHNFYLYLHPKTGKFHFLPWDLDRAFANLPVFGSNKRQMDLSLRQPYPGKHNLTDRLLAMPEVSKKYQKLLEELTATCLSKERVLEQLGAAEAAVKELLARDARAAADRKEGPPYFPFGRPPEMRTFFERRTASVAAQVAGKSKGFVPSGGFGPGAFKVGAMLAGPLLDALDADKDDLLSREEWLANARAVFVACKADAAGLVDQKALAAGIDALFPSPPKGGPQMFRPGTFMAGPALKRADADEDKKLSQDELLAAAGKVFDAHAKSKSGKLDETAFGELLNDLFPMPNAPPPPPAEKPKDQERGTTG